MRIELIKDNKNGSSLQIKDVNLEDVSDYNSLLLDFLFNCLATGIIVKQLPFVETSKNRSYAFYPKANVSKHLSIKAYEKLKYLHHQDGNFEFLCNQNNFNRNYKLTKDFIEKIEHSFK